ncbi:MAG: DUF1080 domain-containing protein [Acidobacteria bacterium]|nr:DUF1080 domain-containing protein [Acidobacteriota bacterium]
MRCAALMLILGLMSSFALVAADNALTPAEVEQGWILLWDGKTEYGWEWHGDARWKVEDGLLKSDGGANGWLGTTTSFGDYELTLDFRTAVDGNSGVFLRSAREGEPHKTGYELQIFNRQPEGYNTGSLVYYAKAQPAQFIGGQWNSYHVRAVGERFVVKLNGREVLDVNDSSHSAGVIGLQYNKDKPVEFRNIKLKPLGLSPLFNGQDLSGWQKVDRPNSDAVHEWSVRDGILHVEKGAGQLETEKAFKNLVLQLAIKTNPPSADHHPNSGVFFRAEKGVFWSGYESQIRNEFSDGDRTKPVDTGTGGLYFYVPARRVIPNDGEFFHKTLVAYGRHTAIWINGIQTADWDDPRPPGNNARRQAKLDSGVLSLQAHDPTTNLDFKDIRAAELAER